MDSIILADQVEKKRKNILKKLPGCEHPSNCWCQQGLLWKKKRFKERTHFLLFAVSTLIPIHPVLQAMHT